MNAKLISLILLTQQFGLECKTLVNLHASLYQMLTLHRGHYASTALQKQGVVTQLLNKRPLTLKRGLQSEEDTVTALCWVTVRHRKTQSSSV